MKLNFTSLLYFQRTAEMQHLTNAAESRSWRHTPCGSLLHRFHKYHVRNRSRI